MAAYAFLHCDKNLYGATQNWHDLELFCLFNKNVSKLGVNERKLLYQKTILYVGVWQSGGSVPVLQ